MASKQASGGSLVMDSGGWFSDIDLEPVLAQAGRLVLVVLVLLILHRFGAKLLARAIRRTVGSGHIPTTKGKIQRANTLTGILQAVFRGLIWILGTLYILSLLSVDIAPLLASAGVLGLAIGLGAQSLIGDYMSGFFIIMENQYRVDDIVEINGVTGVVEHIDMRVTTIRDLDGNKHFLPNGSIQHVANLSMEYAYVKLDIGVGYTTDVDELEGIINNVGHALAKDPDWSEHIEDPPLFLRVQNFADSAMEVRIVGRTKPGQQFSVAGELRRRLKKAFDVAGVEIPFPQRVMHVASTAKTKDSE